MVVFPTTGGIREDVVGICYLRVGVGVGVGMGVEGGGSSAIFQARLFFPYFFPFPPDIPILHTYGRECTSHNASRKEKQADWMKKRVEGELTAWNFSVAALLSEADAPFGSLSG